MARQTKIQLIALSLIWLSSWSTFAIDPAWRFKSLKTAHFDIIYRDTQGLLAKRYAIAAEQAHELLFPLFKEGPARTIVVLQDDTDSTNGLADFLPYPHIVVFPVLPNQNDSIDEYGDWPLEMMLHEYAHILNMYPAHGIYWPFKYIFGSVVRPNAILPRWYLEGLAVDLESRYSDHGRIRSTGLQASARAYVVADRFRLEDIARINESDSREYPYGAKPYNFGGWWWSEAIRTKGEDVIYTWNQNFSRRLPFLLNGPVREQTGSSASELLEKAVRQTAALAKEQIEAIKASGESVAGEFLPNQGNAGPFAISPSGLRLVHWVGLVDQGSYAFLRTRESPAQAFANAKSRRLFRSRGAVQVRWLNDNQFVFDQIDARRNYVQYRDLYLYDLEKDKTERLTDGARAQEPAVSPDGRTIAFVQNEGGRNSLGLLHLESKKIETLFRGSFYQRLASPVFLSVNEILFTGRNRKGEERIYHLNMQSKKVGIWNSQLSAAQNLRRSPIGILATDSASGARNVFLVTKGSATPLTNTLTEITAADFDTYSKSLVVNELTGDGRRLRSIEKRDGVKVAKLKGPDLEPAIAAEPGRLPMKTEDFSPLGYMWPRYWIPWIYPVEGGIIFQGLTDTRDPIGRNQYSLGVSYDTLTLEPGYSFDFANHSFRTSIGLGYNHFVSYLGASGRTVTSSDAYLQLSRPLGNRFTSWSLGGRWGETSSSSATYRRMGPEIAFQYAGLKSPYNETWGWHVGGGHRQYVEQGDYLGYGQSFLHLATALSLGRHQFGLQTRASVAPDMPFGSILDLGERSVGGNYVVNLVNSEFLLRGYPSGAFVGRKMLNANLEYVLPAAAIEKGFGTFPLFLRDLKIAFFGDALAVDGAGFNVDRLVYVRSRLSEFYTGAGMEFRLNTTMAYHLPLALNVGLYYGFNETYGGGFTPFLGVGLGSLSPLSKTP
ncbi:MAG: hypothetical protein AB7F86_13780 [Bdellovibrionales bacterium]